MDSTDQLNTVTIIAAEHLQQLLILDLAMSRHNLFIAQVTVGLLQTAQTWANTGQLYRSHSCVDHVLYSSSLI